MSLANKQTFNLISSLIIGQVMLLNNNVFMNKLVRMKLHFNYIYIYIYMRQSNFFFLYFFLFYKKFLLRVLLPKKKKKQRMRYYCCWPLDFAILTAGACACVFPLWWWVRRRTTKGQSLDLWESRFEAVSKDHSWNYLL